MNRTLLERARSMLSNAKVEQNLWAEAVLAACYLVNRSPSAAIDLKIPQEVWTGHPCDYSHLKIFGCDAYALVNKKDRTKLDPKSKRYIFVGYGEKNGVKGYRLWDPIAHKLTISRDVVFNESPLIKLDSVEVEMKQEQVPQIQDVKVEIDTSPDVGKMEETLDDKDVVDTQEYEESPHQFLRKSTRARHPPERYSPGLSVALASNDGEPCSYPEALEHVHSSEWKKAMQEEMNALEKNHSWDLVELPKGKKTVGCKWVYKLKTGTDGKSERYRARLVAKGFSQKAGIDFHEIFSPVVKLVSIRAVLALVALLNLELEQLDVKTTFLHGDLEEDIYMDQPEGFVQEQNGKFVCKLKKALYGLRQSPRQWYKKFDSFMLSLDFQRSQYDHCVYFKVLDNGIFIILVLYVDDMLVASKSLSIIDMLKAQLTKNFDMKDLGAAKQILGMEIHRDRQLGKLWLSQQKYVEKILTRFGMQNVKPVNVPFASHFKLSSKLCPNSKEEKQIMAHIPYASAVGSLMYAMVCTRPDIAHAVGVVSRFMENPGKQHWEAVKWVLRYLRGTSNYCITFNGNGDSVCGYVDADYAGDLDKRRSTSGYVFTLAGGPICWMSKLQKPVAQSTTEAEYMAINEACKEATWLKGLMGDLGQLQEKVKILCDSQSAIHLSKDPTFHSRTKHIEVKYHYVRQVVDSGGVALEKVHTKENCADMLTKPVLLEKLRWCLTSLGLQKR